MRFTRITVGHALPTTIQRRPSSAEPVRRIAATTVEPVHAHTLVHATLPHYFRTHRQLQILNKSIAATRQADIETTHSYFIDLLQDAISFLRSRRTGDNITHIAAIDDVTDTDDIPIRILHDHLIQVGILYFAPLSTSICQTRMDDTSRDMVNHMTQLFYRQLIICDSYRLLPRSILYHRFIAIRIAIQLTVQVILKFTQERFRRQLRQTHHHDRIGRRTHFTIC